jgi:S-formylglutathione hydrolase FrmB
MHIGSVKTIVGATLLAGGLSCANAPPAAQTPRTGGPAAIAVARPSLSGTVTVKDAATPRGRLVLGWRTAADERAPDAERRLIDTFTPGESVDFAKTPSIQYRIEGAPVDATPFVVLDVDHTFWPTLVRGGPGFIGSGKPGGGEVELVSQPRRADGPEPCSGPRRKLVAVDAPELPSLRPGPRRFCAWLPKDWTEQSSRRYPLILLMPGLLSNEMAYLSGDGDLGLRLDAIAAEMKRDAVLVGVDTSTPLGSTYLEDLPGCGAWDTFLVKRALPTLERELHTIPKRTARALSGQSTGGYNALSYAMRHSDVFSAVGASSPDAPNVEEWLFEPGTRRAREWIRHWAMLDDALGGPGQITSWAATWSPDGSSRGWAWPIDLTTGAADEVVLARWVALTPHGLLRDPAFQARVKNDLGGRILITAGRADEFGLFEPAEHFARELNELGIATRFVPTDSNHGNHQERLAIAFRFLLERLDPASP